MALVSEGALSQFRRSRVVALAGIALLALLLQIPVSMIAGLMAERQLRRDDAVGEVSDKWGRAQAITGPVLALPYLQHIHEQTTDGRIVEKTLSRMALILPDKLALRGDLATQIRSRGIFSVPVYGLDLNVSGEFAATDFHNLGVPDEDIYWDKAEFIVGVSDVRAIQRQPSLTWGERTAEFLPGTGAFDLDLSSADLLMNGTPPVRQTVAGMVNGGIRAPVSVDRAAGRIAFQFPLAVNGSSSLSLVPFGRETVAELRGDSGDASFRGNWLPTDRAVAEQSFSAKWKIPYLGRGYPQVWSTDTGNIPNAAVNASRFGLALVPAVDAYRMAERSVKYSFLFITLTFTVVWLLEVLANVRVHPIQYFLLGAALCLFYLLELSLAEQIGFPAAYVIASTAVVAMIGTYGLAVLQTARRAVLVAAGVAALYAFLYVLLTNEDYALLLGSVGLFAVLGGIMYATRQVDWYNIGRLPSHP